MRSLVRSLLSLALLAGAARAQLPPGARALAVVPKESSVSYRLVHKFHQIIGTTRAVEGKVVALADGRAQVMVRVRADSFDSGNDNRDAHAKEAIDAHGFPFIELKGIAEQVALPAAPAAVDKPLKAQLAFHGVTQAMAIPVKLQALPDGRFRATASFTISLDSFKVERPSLFAVKVDDGLVIDVDLVLAP